MNTNQNTQLMKFSIGTFLLFGILLQTSILIYLLIPSHLFLKRSVSPSPLNTVEFSPNSDDNLQAEKISIYNFQRVKAADDSLVSNTDNQYAEYYQKILTN